MQNAIAEISTTIHTIYTLYNFSYTVMLHNLSSTLYRLFFANALRYWNRTRIGNDVGVGRTYMLFDFYAWALTLCWFPLFTLLTIHWTSTLFHSFMSTIWLHRYTPGAKIRSRIFPTFNGSVGVCVPHIIRYFDLHWLSYAYRVILAEFSPSASRSVLRLIEQ